MNLKRWIGAFILVASLGGLTACGDSNASYQDGTYEGQSSVYTSEDGSDDDSGYGVVSLTIKDGAITACTYQTYEPDGTLKDESYGMEGGKIANRDYYNKAQKAVAACEEYASQLVQSGSAKDVDAITGATINHDLFREAVDDAMSKAKAAG